MSGEAFPSADSRAARPRSAEGAAVSRSNVVRANVVSPGCKLAARCGLGEAA